MNITKEQLDQLSRIYNTMFEIQTKGEDTLILADCIRAFEQVIRDIKGNPIINNNTTFKPNTEEE